jgi:nitrous oxidase accessory protein NosD
MVGNDSLMDDFTAFYIGVDNAVIEDNVFDSPTRVGILGNAAAIEFHAMNCQISNNIVKNFGVGMYVQSNGMDTGQSVMRIHDNTITGLNRTGINVADWAGKAFDVVDIQDNTIVYNSSDVGNPGAVGIIHFFSTPGAEPTRLLTIKGNKIVGPGWGLYLNNASTSIITDNDFVNCTGYAIKGDFKTPVDYLDISRNVMNGVAFVSGQKIAIRSDFTSDCHNLVIAGNNIVNRTDVDQPEYGAVVNMATSGTTINATIEGNVLQGMKYMEAVVLGYPDAATSNVICRINYPSAPAIGWWSVGSHIRETTPASAAPPGWYCTVEGSPGTWVAEANLA